MRYFSHLIILLASLLSTSVFAADIEQVSSQLQTALAKMVPGANITQVKATPITGLYEVIVGSQVVYMTADASYYLNGDMVETATRKNLTDASKAILRYNTIKDYSEDKMLVYTPKQVKHTVTVVTDVNCPYCRRLHSEMDQYMAEGIKVRYIFMPLKGQEDFNTTVSIWCAKDRNKALDTVKAGGQIEAKSCDNPIAEHLNLARSLGVNGTPAIILEDGEMLPGYVPVKTLAAKLNSEILSTGAVAQ